MRKKLLIVLVLLLTITFITGCEKKNINHVDNYDYYTDQ